MFIAHLPAGYLTTALVDASNRNKVVMASALIGSVLPDVDLFYFYLPTAHGGGRRAVGHHHYWSHTPFWWLAIAAVVIGTLLLRAKLHQKTTRLLRPASMLFGNALLHHALDTPMGGIRWAWPLSSGLTHFVDVPARHAHWILNFVWHPSFLIELTVLALAGIVWWRRHHLVNVDGEAPGATERHPTCVTAPPH